MSECEFEVVQDGVPVAFFDGPRDRALAEAMHFAALYGEDGPCEVREVFRIPVDQWEAMVERGAKAICEKDGHAWPNEHEGETPAPGQYFTRDYNDSFQRNAYRKQAADCIRAALSLPEKDPAA